MNCVPSFHSILPSPMSSSEKELEVLEEIYNSPDKIRQRDLAHVVGLSLGMTNAIVKRLAKKGLINVKKVNNRNIQYVVSPEGMEAIARRSYRYFKRTIRNIVDYKSGIEGIISQAIDDGYDRIVLVGESDLDFIIEHICHKKNIAFGKKKVKTERPGWFHLYAETIKKMNNGDRSLYPNPSIDSPFGDDELFMANEAWLRDVVVGIE